jgi:serine protease
LGALALIIVLLASCTTPSAPPAHVLVVDPGAVYSGTTVELDVALVRASTLTGSVDLSLTSANAGITAADVATATSSATLEVVIDATVPAGNYLVTVQAKDADSTVTSDPFTLVVLGPEPGGITGEVRSLMIPSPADGGFPLARADGFATKSFVPGEDVPLAFDEMRLVPGEIVIGFVSDGALNGQAAPQSLTVDGVTLSRSATSARATGGVWTFSDALSVEQTVVLADRIAARPDVAYATPNWLFTVHATPDLYRYQWHYPAIDLQGAWTAETGEGENVVVAVVDTGYQAHVDLDGVFLPGYDFVNDDADPTDNPTDGLSHGTHVSGTIASDLANAPLVAGINRGASILPVKVLDDDGVGSFDGIMDGMVWASGLTVPGYSLPVGVPVNANPARVMNLSLGGRIGACPAQMADVTSYLASQNVIIVVSAGNSSQDTSMFAPANCPGVITVAATGPYDERAYYSNYGSEVDISAPGGNFDYLYVVEDNLIPNIWEAGVLSTIGGGVASDYAWFQGTSMAAPHVTGVVSLLLATDPTMTVAAVRSAIVDTARPIDAWKCDRPDVADCGAGSLDAAAALGAAASGAWIGAPTIQFDLFACADETCGEIDGSSVPIATADAVQTRAFAPFAFHDLAPGFYLVSATVAAPGSDFPIQQGSEIFEVLPGEDSNGVVYAEPNII